MLKLIWQAGSPDGLDQGAGRGIAGGMEGTDTRRGIVTFSTPAVYSSAAGQRHVQRTGQDENEENSLGMSIDLSATPQYARARLGPGGVRGDGAEEATTTSVDGGGPEGGGGAPLGADVGGDGTTCLATGTLAQDQDAALPLSYDGGEEGKSLFKWKKVRDPRPCPSGVLLKYEASCHELLIALAAQHCGQGCGRCVRVV